MKKNKNPKPLKVVISRKKWNRGTDNGSLCNESGAKCALGWALTAIGVPKSMMVGLGGVDEVVEGYISDKKHPPKDINYFVTDYDFGFKYENADDYEEPQYGTKSVLSDIISANDESAYGATNAERRATARERENKLKMLMKELNIDLSFKD
jgi:hypothetical protein